MMKWIYIGGTNKINWFDIITLFQIHTLICSANCLAIIQYNGYQKEEHSMENNLVRLWQPVQSKIDQGRYFANKCNFERCYKVNVC